MTPAPLSVEPLAGMTDDRRREIQALVEAAGMDVGRPPLSDQALIDLEGPHGTGGNGFVVLLSDAAGQRLVAMAIVTPHADVWVVETVADPSGHPPGHLDLRILDQAIEEIGHRGGGTLRLWHHQAATADPTGHTENDRPAPDPIAPPTAQHWRLDRELLQMRVPLPLPGPPPDIPIRSFVPGVDDDEWLRVNNRAFAHHAEQSGWTKAELREREAEPWFDPDGFLLHEATGRLAAFCWTKVHAGGVHAGGVHAGGVLGEIYVIGVDPDFQGRRLGSAMTQAGLAHMAAHGVPTGMLYVDGPNVAAVSLYRKLGFTVDHVDRAWLLDIPAT